MHLPTPTIATLALLVTSLHASPLISRSITDSSSSNSTSSIQPAASNTNSSGVILPGTAANCKTFYVVQEGDTCDIVDAKANISLDTLKTLNKEIDPACDNLVVGQGLCVKN